MCGLVGFPSLSHSLRKSDAVARAMVEHSRHAGPDDASARVLPVTGLRSIGQVKKGMRGIFPNGNKFLDSPCVPLYFPARE